MHTGVISESEAVDQLIESCRLNGLLIDDGMRQCIATVKSGLAKGVADALPNLDSNTTRGDQSSHVRSGHNPEYDTELEMGTAFAKESEDRLKFDHDLKSWFYWDGDVWQQDLGGYVFCLIQDFCTQHDGTRQKRFSSYCGVVNVEKFALNQPAVAVRQNVWDCDKFILGCRVGYVDLGSGEIIPPDPKYYVTKLASTVPKAGRPELWLSLLDYWTNGDAALTRFLQQMCGYLLTGDTSEQVLFFLRGPSATGKGTFSSVLQEILRDYVVSGDERLLAFAGSTSIDEALASARGARVYLFDELPRGFRINDALVKRISGQSRVTARQVYGRRFDYQPTYKILLLSNYDPKIPPDNDALKRRILVIPFERRAEKIDKALRERLRLEHPQILNWMIEGAADWQKNGLVLPNAVRITGDDYFDAHDTIAQFIDECCIVHPSAKEAAGALFEAWEAWAKRRGHPPGSETTFGTDLARRGYGKCWVRIEGAKTRGRSGIRLRKQSSTEPA